MARKVFFLTLICFISGITAQFDCNQTSGENSQVLYSKSCSDGNVLLINWAYFSKSSSPLNCDGGTCYNRDVNDEMKLAYSIDKSFIRVLYVPRFDVNCAGNYVNLGVSTYCIPGAKTYDLMSSFDDGNAYGSQFIFARYNLYSNNNLAFNKATLTVPAGSEFTVRTLEMYAMTNKANTCAYRLVVEYPPGNRVKSPCMGAAFSGDYFYTTTTQQTDASFYLEKQYPIDEFLIDLKLWIMIEIRQGGNYVSGLKMRSGPLVLSTTIPTTTSSTTTTTTTSTTTTTTTTTPPTTRTTTTTTTTLPTTSSTTTTTTTTTTTLPTTTTSATFRPPSNTTTTMTTIQQINDSSITTMQSIQIKTKELSTEAKIGLGVGLSILCLLVLLIILGLIYSCRSRKRHPSGIKSNISKLREKDTEEARDSVTVEESLPDTPPPPPVAYEDGQKCIRIKGSQKPGMESIQEIFNRDPTSIYQPIGDVYSTVSKASSVREWQPEEEEEHVEDAGTVGKVNSYPSDTWELTHYSPPLLEEEEEDNSWDQGETVDPPASYESSQRKYGRSRFQKNQHTNSVIENHSKQKVKKAKHVTISQDPPSYMESQMDRPHNFVGGPNFMF